jgi:hypothetical protein
LLIQTEILDQLENATNKSAVFHAHRRDYIRYSLEQLLLLFTERPALIPPKVALDSLDLIG